MSPRPLSKLWRRLAMGASGSALLLASAHCSTPPADETAQLQMPPFDSFPPVGEALHYNCGTLDCHGDIARNFRLYGQNGLRLDPMEYPGSGVTTPDELHENYLSVISVEPELTAAVYAEGGAHPERLTLVRKGRGAEHHKGGKVIDVGSPADVCLTSWLAGAVDEMSCMLATEILPPQPQGSASAPPPGSSPPPGPAPTAPTP